MACAAQGCFVVGLILLAGLQALNQAIEGIAEQAGGGVVGAEVLQTQLGPAVADPLFQIRRTAEGFAPFVIFLRSPLGGGINGQAPPEA